MSSITDTTIATAGTGTTQGVMAVHQDSTVYKIYPSWVSKYACRDLFTKVDSGRDVGRPLEGEEVPTDIKEELQMKRSTHEAGLTVELKDALSSEYLQEQQNFEAELANQLVGELMLEYILGGRSCSCPTCQTLTEATNAPTHTEDSEGEPETSTE